MADPEIRRKRDHELIIELHGSEAQVDVGWRGLSDFLKATGLEVRSVRRGKIEEGGDHG